VINFRYHVVSLTAVFLALAIGLVLGTAALNGPLANDLKNRVTSLTGSNEQLRDQVREQQEQMESQDDFVAQVAPTLLVGKLTGKRVLVVYTSTAEGGDVDAVTESLKLAGATITGRLRVTERYTDPASASNLADLSSRVLPEGVTVPSEGDAVEDASTVLAAVLTEGGPPVTPASRTTVLTAFGSAQMVTVEGEQPQPADSVVVVTGRPATDSVADDRNKNLLTMVRQLEATTGEVVLASSIASGDGNPVAAVRGDSDLSKKVATVDNVSTAEGHLATVLALAERFARKVGHYGTGDGATALIPPASA
jgi:Copper transport outer membrane protein, MctB